MSQEIRECKRQRTEVSLPTEVLERVKKSLHKTSEFLDACNDGSVADCYDEARCEESDTEDILTLA